MKKLIALSALALTLAVTSARADDTKKASAEETVSSDTSHNPITGSKTLTKKHKRVVKGAHGEKSTHNAEAKTKMTKDGTETTTKVEDTAKPADTDTNKK